MRKVAFTKMHGAGNDFILIDDRDGGFPIDDHRRIVAMATRPDGVGCEGVIIVQRCDTADFKMRFFNPDGTEAELCGNGARCVAAFAHEKGIAKGSAMRFETTAGAIEAELLGDGVVKVSMPDPRVLGDDFAIVGVPHKIVVTENLPKADVAGEGRRIRLDYEFAPDGTNVDFVTYHAPDKVSIRTYERGVEAETGACGTGAVASAAVGVRDYGLSFPVRVATTGGYELVVDGSFDGESFSGVTLSGPVRKVFDGVLDWDALEGVRD